MKNKRKFILLTLAIIIIESSLLVKGRELLNIFSSIDIIFKEEVQQGAVPVMRYHSINQAFEDDKTIKGEVKKNITSFSLKSIGNKSKVWFELSPNIKNNFFSITKIQIRIGGFIVKEYNTDVLQNDFFDIYNIDSSEYKKDEIIFHTEDKDPYIVFTLGFQSKPHILIVCFIFMIWLIVSFVLLGHGEINNRYISRLLMITGIFFTMLGGILWVFKAYLVERYGDLPIFQLIFYHLNEPLKGTNLGQFKDLYYRIGKISCLLICVIGIGYFIFKFIDRKSFFRINLFLGGSFLLVFALEQLCTSFDLIDYFQYIKEETDIYDTYYVDPKTVSFEFENKRNLIYIFVESMEISFADKQMGGGIKEENYIPELSMLVQQGCDFSAGNKLNGAYVFNGNDFTTGAMIGQTSGIPLNSNIINSNKLLGNTDELNIKGIYSLGDILEDNGYKQILMIGSEAEFGGRRAYFEQHGNYGIFDYNSALENHSIPEGYKVWWGFEDEKLFSFAKDKALELSKEEEPFNLTLLTADTHFTDGYVCELCNNEFPDQYSNVLSCASRQIEAFVSWIQEQDFYENTTIVICGDHLYMDAVYINKCIDPNYQRKTYVNFINSPIQQKNFTNREYSTLDLYPTTLASLGVDIEGDRLGLGTNLFSDKQTLIEMLGYEKVNSELKKNSSYYMNKILLGW